MSKDNGIGLGDCPYINLDSHIFQILHYNFLIKSLYFSFISNLYNNASIILTSNKAPKEWGGLLGDPAITTAILDRIMHRVEIVHLNEDSYRMKHRTSIFKK